MANSTETPEHFRYLTVTWAPDDPDTFYLETLRDCAWHRLGSLDIVDVESLRSGLDDVRDAWGRAHPIQRRGEQQ